MGHFYSKNVSETIVEIFNVRGYCSIQEVVDVLKERKETIHAAEGEYDEDYMLCHGVETLFFGYQEHYGCIRPDPATESQREILKKWEDDPFDFDEPDYKLMDTIPWLRVSGTEIPVIDYEES